MRTKRRTAALAAVLASSALMCGCAIGSSSTSPGPRSPAPVVLASSQVNLLRAYGAGDSAFGLNMLATLCHRQPGANVVISPVSLATGLGMANLGARAATATAISRVLHLPATGRSLATGLAARSALLASLNRPGVTFTTSNRVWADPSLITNPGFVAALRAGYQAALAHLPLLTKPDQARSTINAAVARETRGHITNLLPPGSIAPGTIGWVLTDALYLNAKWKHSFDARLTQPGPFFTRGRAHVTASYMNGGSFRVVRTSGWTAVSLPYTGNRLSMLALLPPINGLFPGNGCQLPTAIGLNSLAAALATTRTRTEIALPKVKLAFHDSLQGPLTSLGMGIAFTSRANFRGLSPQACCIAFVQHAATISVDEKGTIASAATGIGVQISAATLVLKFDRPYLMVLRDSLTGEPLMLAWVANPASH